jgi:hypothetical protein
LRVLAERLNYLGRAESWVECSLLEEDLPIDRTWVRPCLETTILGPAGSKSRCWPLFHPTNMNVWRLQKISMAQEQREQPAKKYRKPGEKNCKTRDIFPVICWLVCKLKPDAAESWLEPAPRVPPGSLLAPGLMPFGFSSPQLRPGRNSRPAPFALLAVSSSARSRSVLPLRERSLAQADLLHRTLVFPS